MNEERHLRPESVDPERVPRRTPAGQSAIVGLGLAFGIILMGMQLWLLTLAFDLYLSDEPREILVLAGFSGLVFLGGLLMLRLLDRDPRPR